MGKKKYLGKELRVVFWDHSSGFDSECKCIVWGICITQTPRSITIASWDLPAEKDPKDRKNNQEICTILISTIEDVRQIEAANCKILKKKKEQKNKK